MQGFSARTGSRLVARKCNETRYSNEGNPKGLKQKTAMRTTEKTQWAVDWVIIW